MRSLHVVEILLHIYRFQIVNAHGLLDELAESAGVDSCSHVVVVFLLVLAHIEIHLIVLCVWFPVVAPNTSSIVRVTSKQFWRKAKNIGVEFPFFSIKLR